MVTLGPFAELIPMPVIGGLLLVIGGELIVGRISDIKLVVRTAWLPTVAMVVTFAATTTMPLQYAIFLGAGLSLILYCVAATKAAKVQSLVRESDGSWRIADPPASAPSNEVTVVHYAGVSLFAEVPLLDTSVPDAGQSSNAVVVLVLRSLPDVASSTVLKGLARLHDRLSAQGKFFNAYDIVGFGNLPSPPRSTRSRWMRTSAAPSPATATKSPAQAGTGSMASQERT